MAGQAAKKLVERNKKTLRIIDYGFIIPIVIYVAIRIALRFKSIHWLPCTIFAIVSLLNLYITLNLHKVAAPTIVDGAIVRPGRDVMAGLNEYKVDVLAVLGFVMVLAALWDWLWLIASIIPGYVVYKVWTMFIAPWLFADGGSKEMTPEQKKELERIEARRQRKKAKRVR
ncbi:Protein of unknown function DUF788, TMEM208 [Carpediemonas membranifera]|uniref:Transmembrane protein 208 n=1 Tax=Carpediemonas membranifera TaxID=201153 RepID=A0A8J6AXY3_9EUKA|nr:Protein of unknown function DUF788, TMEM208 [Carpediemonas membranifera]|eukprot:KAG9397591.1 Protein of unknown function DUF788, TMEM208 [Carpediemonas membranifera]